MVAATMNTKQDNQTPAHLFIGQPEMVVHEVVAYLQKKLCINNGCGVCRVCLQVESQQHHAVTWLAPEKQYTLDQLEPIFNTIAFALEPDQHHFFIIQKADFLTPTCSNSLLKSLEEPPAGYHFILLAQRSEQLLPTIRSRCMTHSIYGSGQGVSVVQSELFTAFTDLETSNPADFLKILDQSKIAEQESVELLDQLLAHWLARSKTALCEDDTVHYQAACRVITLLKNSYEQLPMPGSSKLFWKNIYLRMIIS